MNDQQTVSRLVSLGHAQPGRTVTNDQLGAQLATSPEWIEERIGIEARRIADPGDTVADLAAAAATAALARSGLAAEDVDLVVVATCTAFERMPNIACRVAERLSITAPAAFDLNAACSGFSCALATADHAIRAGSARRAIVVGADKMSDFVDWADRTTCVIFGDGAAAAVVEAAPPGEPGGIGPVVWGSAPEKGSLITLETDKPNVLPALFRQQGPAVFRWATTELAPVAREACRRAGVDPAELNGVVTHQANLRIIRALARGIGAPDAVVATDLVESGNTSAASIPLALSKLIEKQSIVRGDRVLLFGFGAGLTYAGQVVTCP
ncbi:beta-ketoacyl-ACP synthase 3 [Amycolatopsis sp. WQ 127309]|uniref:beta-ketoacyl-ACP synthase 3 n=1 Tax=Amycolatopsis sp. WQ 127309 TaxID=2932773 RepID=UPI001FF0F9D4|nr:beta-ketoacyl-ACP synthase 3 [Amycolatopsis sp. WQ 127309]UOZ07002.1 beta-ketoacyl-ACP synthase 3 [Amycolatopsis sp. WQ 127309]